MHSQSSRFLILFGTFSLIATLSGCLAAHLHAVPGALWGRDLVAWLVGALFAAFVWRNVSPRALPIAVLAAPFLLLACFLDAGQLGVHRWIHLGPVRVNAAALFLPAVVVAVASFGRLSGPLRLAVIAVTALLATQPDASQTTAFVCAMVAVRARSAVAMILIAAASWLRHDPLLPVSEVEGILGLASATSPALAVLAATALAVAALSPVLLATGTAAIALSAYFLCSSLAPLFGAFPVPLVGISMSPILGFWFGVGMLAAVQRHSGSS